MAGKEFRVKTAVFSRPERGKPTLICVWRRDRSGARVLGRGLLRKGTWGKARKVGSVLARTNGGCV